MSTKQASQWMTVEETCEHARISESSLYELMNRGVLKGYKLGGKRLFDRSQVDRAIRGGK